MSMDLIQTSNKLVIDNEDLGADYTSELIDLSGALGFAAHFVWTGGSSTGGNIIIEVTNDDPNTSVTQVWTQLSSDAVATDSGSLMKNNANQMYSYMRVFWDRSAGSGGTIRCRVSVKR